MRAIFRRAHMPMPRDNPPVVKAPSPPVEVVAPSVPDVPDVPYEPPPIPETALT